MAKWGYQEVTQPNHPRARANGCVLEHVLVVEDVLGRFLADGETVHHIDNNRSNNVTSNLMVFRTKEDHARFHKGGVAELEADGVYVCRSNFGDTPCAVCGKLSRFKHCSRRCANFGTRKVARPSKDQLLDDLRVLSFVAVGRKYGVSDNAVRKWLKRYT